MSGSTPPKVLQSSGGQESGGQGAQADLFTGAATHSINLAVPPGPGGLKPNINLNYNSQRKNANSIVGYGWDIDLGSIERIAEDDGRIDYESGTKFAARLGGQVLTLSRTVEAANPSDYGISSYAGYYADVYQANVEEAFTIYLHVYDINTDGNMDDLGWFVKDKSGLTYQFGTDADRYSIIESEIENDEGETVNWISRWNLALVEDADGNTIDITYASAFQPNVIVYGEIAIVLTYSERPYFPTYKQYSLDAGQINERMDAILVYTPEHVATYTLGYSESTYGNHTLLTSVTQTDGDGNSLPPTTFDYYDIDPATFKWSTTANEFSGSRSDCTFPTTFNHLSEYTLVTDMNGDALPDLVLSCSDESVDTIKVLFNNGNDFEDRGSASTWTDPLHQLACDQIGQGSLGFCGKLNGGYPDSYGPNQKLYLIDMNGDALPDRVLAAESSFNADEIDFYIAFNTGTGFDSTIEQWHDPIDSGASDSQRSLLDMNGDGLVDRIYGHNDIGGFEVFYNYGAGFRSESEHWTDPLSLYGDTTGHADIYSPYTGNQKNFYLMDFNGDGYIDRFRLAGPCYDGDDLVADYCTVAYLNREGHEWSIPELEGEALVGDGVDEIGIIDAVTDEDYIGSISPITDWMDFNGDGIVDRVYGNTENGNFEVSYYNGRSSSAGHATFESTVRFSDPISDSDKKGYITYSEDVDSEGTYVYTFITDMNGDGYPDRVHADGNKFYVYPMVANEVEFSDAAASYDYPHVNQPPLALKSIDDGRGGKMVLEYLPATVKRRDSDNRFLPFNVYTVHKIYHEDATITSGDGTPEYNRHPGMRYVTYDYYGGNFYVQNAVKASSDRDDETLTTTHSAVFNGFGEVVITSAPLGGETWDSITEKFVFHQALGDIHTVAASDETYYDADAYLDLARSGRLFKHTKVVSGTTLLAEELDWGATVIDADLDINQITLDSQIQTVTEPGETNSRRSKTAYTYDTNGNVLSIIHYDKDDVALLETTNTYYDESSFDADLKIRNRLETSTVSLGGTTYRKSAYANDTLGHVTTETDYADETTSYTTTKTHDAYGNVETITGPDGVTHTMTYDDEGMFVESDAVTMPTGATFYTRFSNDRMTGQPKRTLSNSGIGGETEYDGFGRPINNYHIDTAGTENLDASTSYTYGNYTVDGWSDIVLLKVQTWIPQSGYADTETSGNPAKISYSNAIGQVLQTCDYTERGDYRLVQFRSSNGGRAATQTEPVFASNCDFISTLSSGVATTTRTNDVNGRPVYLDLPDGDTNSPVNDFTLSYSTNADGHLTRQVQTTSLKSISEEYDDYGRLAEKTDPSGNTLQYAYNPAGDLQTVTSSTTLLSVTVDWLGRKLTSEDPNLGTWNYEYNSSGLLYRQTDNNSQITEFEYDAVSRVSQKNIYDSTGAIQKYVNFTYDAGDANHDVTLGELFGADEYDSTGALTRSTKQGYDTLYRNTNKITRSLSAGDFAQTIESDFRGQQSSVTFPGGTSLYYQYNRLGGMNKICSDAACASAYYSIDDTSAYDEFGNLLAESYGNGVTSAYSYFANSRRLESLVTAKGSTNYSSRSYTYDYESNITAIADALGQRGAGAYSSVAYDDLDRMTSYTPSSTGTATSLSYSSNGNIETNAASFGSDAYQYTSSKIHAVTQIGTRAFSYDNNGNMTTDGNRTMTYDAENQLTAVAMTNGVTATYDYDFTGSRVKKAVTRTDTYNATTTSTTEYLGDVIEVRDDLVVLNIHAGPKKIVTRTLGTISDLLGTSSASLRGINITPKFNLSLYMPLLMTLFIIFILASLRPVEVSSPLPLWERVRGARERGLWYSYCQTLQQSLAQFHHRPVFKLISITLIFAIILQFPTAALAGSEGAPETDTDFFYYHHGDFLGSSHIITEGNTTDIHSGITYASGDIVQRFEYYPFGQESYVLNPNLELEVSFTGQKYDDETGLYYYRARYYDPQLARFIQPDTVIPDATDLQAYNRYSYVANNPLKYTDPTGHWPGGGGGGGIDTGGYSPMAPDMQDDYSGQTETGPQLDSMGGATSYAMMMFFGGVSTPNWMDVVYIGTIRICGTPDGECPSEGGSSSSATEIPVDTSNVVSVNSFSSPLYLTSTVPGLLYWNTALNDFYSGHYVLGALNAAATVADIGIFMASLGQSMSARSAMTTTSTVSKSVKWNPIKGQGPLSQSIAETFRSGTYTETVTSETTTLFRVYGGKAGKIGKFWSKTAPKGPLQSTIDSALNSTWGNTANNIVKIRVPAGTTIYEGIAAPQRGLVGGGSQVYLPKIDPRWILP